MATLISLAALDALSDDDQQASTIVFLMCCFNRRAKTLNALQCISEQEVSNAVSVAVVLFDDNSDDGTVEAVRKAFPLVEIHRGDGDAYWARGMAQAQALALDVACPDYFCWLNDDVTLDPEALSVLLATSRACHDKAAVVGALTDAMTSELTYSGYERVGPRPTQLLHVVPNGRPTPVDTFNGNAVLIPRFVYERVGSIDPRYEHAFGDTDYGYRIARAGLKSVLAPRAVGQCFRNSFTGTWQDPLLGNRERLALLVSRKGIPPRSFLYFQWQHGGVGCLVNVLGTYLHAIRTIFGSRKSVLPRHGR